jgi:hypothetical protein
MAYTRETHGFSALGGYEPSGYELTGTGEPAQINGARMTAGVFAALSVPAMLGRVFPADEDEHHQQVAVRWEAELTMPARFISRGSGN